MGVVTIDYETFYSREYSLSRMNEIEYILNPLYQTIMCAIKVNDEPSQAYVGHDAVAKRLSEFDWSKTCLCSHNMRFDGAIAAWHFGVNPALYLDTLGMARALTHARIGKSSLDAVSEYLGLPAKGKHVHEAIGMRLEDMSVSFLADYVAYCLRDNDNCRLIFNEFMKVFPKSELRLIDTVLRMFIEPQVKLNPNALAVHLANVRAEKAAVMAKVAHIDKSVFSSNIKFAALLEEYGVEPPKKISPATGLETFAFAKNDRAFKELCEDGDQPIEVQAILAARIGTKSTIEETRTDALLNLSLREWDAKGQGWAPVPIKYYGAHTGRVSGDGGFNWLNFKRGSMIRDGVEAPPGHRIVHRDASQIEARMVAYLAGCQKLLEAFRDPTRDPYCEFASVVYRRRITTADKLERFVGKTGVLQLNYGCGAPKFRHTLFIGNGGISVSVDEKEAGRIVYAYRDEYKEVKYLWELADQAIRYMIALAGRRNLRSTSKNLDWNLHDKMLPIVDVGPDAIWLPNGMCIAYPELDVYYETDANGKKSAEIKYKAGYGYKKLYGAKAIENISQGLTRIIVTDTADRVRQQTDYHPFLHTYDSLDYCVPESDAEAFDALLDREFAVVPSWAPGLPLASEGGWGHTLLQAEKGLNQ